MTPISYFERVSIIIYVFNKQIIVFIIIKSVSNSKNRIVKSRSLVRSQKSEKQRFFPIAIAKKIFFASIKFHLLFSIRNRYKIAIIIKNRSRSRSPLDRKRCCKTKFTQLMFFPNLRSGLTKKVFLTTF